MPTISDLSGGGSASSPAGQGQCTPDTQFQNGGSAQQGPGDAPSPGPSSPGPSSPDSSPPGSSPPGSGQSPRSQGPGGQSQSGSSSFSGVQVNWHSGAYVPGVFGRVNFNLGPASFTVNGALNLVNSTGNIFADGIGALTSPFDTYQGEMTSAESGIPEIGGVLVAGTMLFARLSTDIRAAKAYSVAFETTIAKLGVGTRPGHFAAANRALQAEINSDAGFASMMNGLGVKVPNQLGRSPNGWTWHHVPDRPGAMQLVPRSQHQGSAWQSQLHPGGSGGFAQWGDEY